MALERSTMLVSPPLESPRSAPTSARTSWWSDPSSIRRWRGAGRRAGNACQQVGVVRELGGVLEGQPGGSLRISGHDQGRDLDHLTIPASARTRLPLRARDVPLCSRGVAVVGGDDGEQGVLDCPHRAGRERAEEVRLLVMRSRCAGALT